MSDYAINAFCLGHDTELDAYLGNWSVAKAFSLVGNTFGSATMPLSETCEELELEATGPAGGVSSSHSQNALHPLIAPQAADPLEGALTYHVTVRTGEGQSYKARMSVLQDELGRLFLTSGRAGSCASHHSVVSVTIDRLAAEDMAWLCSDVEASSFVTSFLEGTRLIVAGGEIPVEQLEIGDMVQTLDHGLQPIVWMGCQHVMADASEAPIRIGAGALGMGWPKRPLYVSPQHRVLVASDVAMQMFDQPQVLVPAKKLLGLPNITQCSVNQPRTYWHVMTRTHEVLFAESALVESFLPGPLALSALPERNRRNLFLHQPSLVLQRGKPKTIRRCVEGARAEILVERLARSQRPALEASCLGGAASDPDWEESTRARRAAAVRCQADVTPRLLARDAANPSEGQGQIVPHRLSASFFG